jgi:hypothetical protein
MQLRRTKGRRVIAPLILNLGTRYKSMVSNIARPLYPREKQTRCPLHSRLGGPQSRCGRFGGREKSLLPVGNRTSPRLSSPWPNHYTVLIYRGGHNTAHLRHWCGSGKLPVKNNFLVVYMHTRLTVNGVLKDLL